MGYIHTHISVNETGANADRTQVYLHCKLSLDGWYGLTKIALKKVSGYTNYIGWPRPFPTEKGYPDSRLSNGSNISDFAGTLPGTLISGRKYSDGYYRSYYEWDETVSIPRSGNKKQDSKTIEVGAVSQSNDWEFPSATFKQTYYNTKIEDAVWRDVISNVTPPTEKNRTITIIATFTNPSNFYTAYIYNNSGIQIASSNTGTVTFTETVTRDMYQTDKNYTLKIFGKDNSQVGGTRSVKVYIEPSGSGIYTKDNGVKDVGSGYFKNNNHKEITEIWIKDENGVIRKTEK